MSNFYSEEECPNCKKKTQEECQVDYEKLPAKNRAVMEHLAERLIVDYFKEKKV